jgi:acyl-CoA thioesterase-1
MKHILFFGDSLTAGYGLPDPAAESFPALISQKISEAALNYSVTNAGLSGDTSAGGLHRLDYWLNRPVDVFVLELGINDMIRRIPPAVTGQNLRSIVATVKQRHPDARLALMGMQLPAFLPGAATAVFSGIYKNLAAEFNMAFVPFFLSGVAGKRQFNLQDGFHPSAAGYRVIADKVWPVLRPLLT